MTDECIAAYHALSAYTMSLGDDAFIHQHVVDAFGAQSATPDGRPIRLWFSLAGLYLHLERGCTGREVQRAHTRMANARKAYPALPLPEARGAITAIDVMRAPPGPERDAAITAWCASVWHAFRGARPAVIAMLDALRIASA